MTDRMAEMAKKGEERNVFFFFLRKNYYEIWYLNLWTNVLYEMFDVLSHHLFAMHSWQDANNIFSDVLFWMVRTAKVSKMFYDFNLLKSRWLNVEPQVLHYLQYKSQG